VWDTLGVSRSIATVREATFGRRATTHRQPKRAVADSERLPDFGQLAAEETPFLPPQQQAVSLELSPDEELQAWKAERRRERLARVPWRQLSLMASLCFGIASFVLPDSVNDSVQWLLWGLMGLSLYAGFARRKRAASA
jgi:hypothetical protein